MSRLNDPDLVPNRADECAECGRWVDGGEMNQAAYDAGFYCCDECWNAMNTPAVLRQFDEEMRP